MMRRADLHDGGDDKDTNSNEGNDNIPSHHQDKLNNGNGKEGIARHSSIILGEEKYTLAYRMGQQERQQQHQPQQQKQESIPVLRGIGKKNQDKKRISHHHHHHHNKINNVDAEIHHQRETEYAPVQHEYFVDESSFPNKKKSREDNPSYISYLDESPPSNNNLLLPADDIEPMPIPTNDYVVPQHRPGAYAHAPGSNLQRLEQLRFSLIGAQPGDQATNAQQENLSSRHLGSSSGQLDSHIRDTARELPSTSSIMPNLDNNNSEGGLVEALPVSTSFYPSSSRRMEAQPVFTQLDQQQQQAARREAQEKKNRRFVSLGVFVVIACLVLIGLSLFGLRVTREEEQSITNDVATEKGTVVPTSSPTKPLPLMDNLELLYEELPEKTKESLYNPESSQYKAWDWLLNHPNISSYPEWRKKQVFAMSTIYYSFEGPNWPGPIGSRWMDVNTSECAWVMTEAEIAFFTAEGFKILGAGAYDAQDYRPCNEDGELQLLGINQLFLPADLIPSIPPEIGLLTSLKMLGIAFGMMNAKLSDWLIPELIQLPNLEGINFRSNGVSGTIPREIGFFTGLRHILLGGNALTGTLPSEIARMTSLEYVSLGDEENLMGKLPSELGLMTSLTDLGIFRSSFTGTIPTELGSLSRLTTLYLDENQLTGAIPSQLGLLTANTWLSLYENRLTGSLCTELGLMRSTTQFLISNNALFGSIPSELGLMTNAIEFRLGNDLDINGPRNNFSGSLPTALWELSHLKWLFLSNLPNLHGRVPTEIMMPNLTMLSLSGSPYLSGVIPDQACLFVNELDFDCSDLLCGCDCECGATGMINNSETSEATNESSNLNHDEQEWPGQFPTPVNRTNAITINIRTDRHPEETKYEWSLRNSAGLWMVLDSEEPQKPEKIHSYTKEVESNSVYMLELFDSEGDGTCCSNGFGWFTITNSTPSPDHPEGTVIWEAAGSLLGGSFHIYIWVDREGRANVLEHLTGPQH